MTKTESNMNGQNLIAQKYDARWGIFKFKHAAMGFLLGVFFFPSYFGINLGFDLTVLRIFEMILLVFIYANKIRLNQFINLIANCKQNIWIFLYFVVVCYTNIIRGFAIKGILYTFFNIILVFYLLYYLVEYEWGVAKFIKYIKSIVVIVCLISILELVIGFPPFSILDTLGKSDQTGIMRSGSLRVSGMSRVANGFGLYLMLLMPVCAYDEKLKRVDILKNKWLVILIIITAFLTGSRLAVGTAVIELILLVFFSPKGIRFKTVLYGSCIMAFFIAVIVLLQNTPLCKSILLAFFSAYDEVFNTTLSVEFGANMIEFDQSSYYRELLWRGTFFDSWLNPLLGQGGDFKFSYWYKGYALQSVDNYYVGLYIAYGLTGLITWIIMCIAFVILAIKSYVKKLNKANIVVIIAAIGYFVSLWYLDHLETFPIMISLFAMSCVNDKKQIDLFVKNN